MSGVDGSRLGTASWNGNTNTRVVAVSIKRNSDGQYWGGSAFNAGTTEVFNTATDPIDFDGVSRPQGARRDMGAYEFK